MKPQRRDDRREDGNQKLCVLRVSAVRLGPREFAQAAEILGDSSAGTQRRNSASGSRLAPEHDQAGIPQVFLW